MKKTCCNCHWGQGTGNNKICLPEGTLSCFESHDHYNWKPMTNGDMVRKMTDRELADLWGKMTDIDPAFIECGDEVKWCKWPNFMCEGCPETFFNWLQAEAEDEKD